MDIRQALNNNRWVAASCAILVPLALLYLSWHQFSKPVGPTSPTKCFFTTDDGKTTFVGPIDHPAHFEQDGVQAVEAEVYTCDGGTHQWVAYLRNGDLVKRPGDAKWVSQFNPKGQEILLVKCPDGNGRPQMVWP